MTNELNSDSMEPMETIQAGFDCSDLENPMGKSKKDTLRVDFGRKLKLEFHASVSHQRYRFDCVSIDWSLFPLGTANDKNCWKT